MGTGRLYCSKHHCQRTLALLEFLAAGLTVIRPRRHSKPVALHSESERSPLLRGIHRYWVQESNDWCACMGPKPWTEQSERKTRANVDMLRELRVIDLDCRAMMADCYRRHGLIYRSTFGPDVVTCDSFCPCVFSAIQEARSVNPVCARSE